jgi:hypothetical protein
MHWAGASSCVFVWGLRPATIVIWSQPFEALIYQSEQIWRGSVISWRLPSPHNFASPPSFSCSHWSRTVYSYQGCTDAEGGADESTFWSVQILAALSLHVWLYQGLVALNSTIHALLHRPCYRNDFPPYAFLPAPCRKESLTRRTP